MAIGRPIKLTPNIASKNISIAATEGQTEFTVTGGYRINDLAVYRNGVRLVDGRDFSATNGTTVTLISDTVVADDVIEFSVIDNFNVAGVIVGAASTQTLSGNLHVTGELYAGTFMEETLSSTNLNVSGVGTVTTIESTTLKVGTAITANSGIVTATAIDAGVALWIIGASGSSHYTFTGPGNLSSTNDPTLNLIRGQKYVFRNTTSGSSHPFRIQSTINGSAGTAYNTGVTNNDGVGGEDIIFDVPYDAPSVLYYQCTLHANMGGAMYISGSGYEVKVGAAITIGSAGIATVGVNTSQGVVLTSANGTKYRVFVENDGSLKTAAN